MGVRVRPIQVGDSVKIKLRDGARDGNAILKQFDESRAYEVIDVFPLISGRLNMFRVAGFKISFYEDEAIEIVGEDAVPDQFYDSSEALTDFLGLFAVGKEG